MKFSQHIWSTPITAICKIDKTKKESDHSDQGPVLQNILRL
jgi:hypothetical protein